MKPTARVVTARVITVILPVLLLMLPGCRQEETRRMPETQIQSRAKAVREAERKRWEAQQQEIREAAAKAQAEQAAAAPASPPSAETPATPPAYLPPSADGAEVEITETPAGSPPPAAPPAAAQAPTAAAAASPAGAGNPAGAAAGSGGQVPAGGSPATGGGPAAGAAAAAGAGRMLASPPPAPEAAALGTTAPATSAEQAAALQRELQRKLETFDTLMRRAQENAAREAAAQGDPDGGPEGRGGLTEAPPEGPGRGGAAATATGLGNTPDKSGETTLNRRPPARGGAQLGQVDGADDDIVARQLREAAERESDPTLREKLWDEYRNYKSGL